MPNSEYISDEEFQQLIVEAMIREQKEKQQKYIEVRPCLHAPALEPVPLRHAEEDAPEERRVIVIDI